MFCSRNFKTEEYSGYDILLGIHMGICMHARTHTYIWTHTERGERETHTHTEENRKIESSLFDKEKYKSTNLMLQSRKIRTQL